MVTVGEALSRVAALGHAQVGPPHISLAAAATALVTAAQLFPTSCLLRPQLAEACWLRQLEAQHVSCRGRQGRPSRAGQGLGAMDSRSLAGPHQGEGGEQRLGAASWQRWAAASACPADGPGCSIITCPPWVPPAAGPPPPPHTLTRPRMPEPQLARPQSHAPAPQLIHT